MREIPLTQGKVALVDDADHEWLSQWKWFAKPGKWGSYAARKRHVSEGKGPILVFMHRAIMGVDGADTQIDHVDHDGLNNQRANLRLCTGSQNCQNRRPRKGGTSPYKGVSWISANRKWTAQVGPGKGQYLGLFDDETEAARAYDAAARERFGEFAYTNFSEEIQP